MSAYAVNKEFPEAERAKLNEVINKVIKGEEFKTWLKSVFSLNVEGGSTARYDELNNRLLGELFKVKK
jgi:tripartite-type tricarboxylate transporter receptor subunit TctC